MIDNELVVLIQPAGFGTPLIIKSIMAPITLNPLGNVMLNHDVEFKVSVTVKFIFTVLFTTLEFGESVAVTLPTVSDETSAPKPEK